MKIIKNLENARILFKRKILLEKLLVKKDDFKIFLDH